MDRAAFLRVQYLAKPDLRHHPIFLLANGRATFLLHQVDSSLSR